MTDEIEKMLESLIELDRQSYEHSQAEYSLDLPNENYHHAVLKGIIIENSFSPIIGEYNLLFETANEKIYVWTHSKDKDSALISDISLSVKEVQFWKTAGGLINLSDAYYRAFEGVNFDSIVEYKIMRDFKPANKVQDLDFLHVDSIELTYLFGGLELKATEVANYAQLIELMNRDDTCFTAVSLLFSSFQIHYCCLICELGLSSHTTHESCEPELWERANYITNMESAIVQACRCAESILGKPPKVDKLSRVNLHKTKWVDLVGINPDDSYARSGMSYWDFYIKMFDELRNPSAHSYGNIHFDLERKNTIDAQCFSALILKGYIDTNKKTVKEALDILKFNSEFLDRVKLKMSTPLTKNTKVKKASLKNINSNK